MDKFKNKYRIPTARIANFDYGSNALYFITICTKNKVNYFGNINVETHDYASKKQNNTETDNHPSLQYSHIGEKANEFWKEIPDHFPFAQIDEYVIMPNHLHGIILINKDENTEWQPNKFGNQSRNIASIIRGYKSSLKRYANINNIEFEWQNRYYDHIIRNEKALNEIRSYISNNPLNWANDELNGL